MPIRTLFRGDIIVEVNDIVTVAGMTGPKPLPNELLSELAVSTETKLQSFQYFKQYAKALEKRVIREAKFYGALIRCLKVKMDAEPPKTSSPVRSAYLEASFPVDNGHNKVAQEQDPIRPYRDEEAYLETYQHDDEALCILWL
ncbi:hypothetical protein Tco_1000763 [Tanacetum coccineum]